MKRKLIFTLTAAVFLTACMSFGTDERPSASLTEISLPGELRQIINKNRAAAFPPPHPNLEDIIAGYTRTGFDEEEDNRIAKIVQREIHARLVSDNPSVIYFYFYAEAFLAHEQLAEDIDFLFDLLRHAYGGYLFFGGDDVFLPVRDAILERLAGMDNPLELSRFPGILFDGLADVVADNHFQMLLFAIGLSPNRLHMNSEYILRRDGNGFTTEISGTTYRVLEVTPIETAPDQRFPKNTQPPPLPSGGIMPTLTSDGELAWAFARVTRLRRQAAVEITVLLENTVTGERHSRPVSLQMTRGFFSLDSPAFAIHEAEGITVLENRNLCCCLAEDFLRSACELRDRPILIMDLRGHTGGRATFPHDWVRIYTGHDPARSLFFASTSNPATRTLEEFHGISIPYDDVQTQRVSGQMPIPNENLVIVLTDNSTSSAGELFVGYLRQLENVLVIGTNTSGTLLTGPVGVMFLPHSGLPVTFGTQLHLRPDLSQFEGVGFMPDLWVPPGESLERVLRFIERYGLANK